jgi:uncharacterized protein YcbX
VEKHGLKYEDLFDRQFLVVDGQNRLVTGRNYPTFVLIKTCISGGCVTLNAPEFQEIKVPLPIYNDDDTELVETSVSCFTQPKNWIFL